MRKKIIATLRVFLIVILLSTNLSFGYGLGGEVTHLHYGFNREPEKPANKYMFSKSAFVIPGATGFDSERVYTSPKFIGSDSITHSIPIREGPNTKEDCQPKSNDQNVQSSSDSQVGMTETSADPNVSTGELGSQGDDPNDPNRNQENKKRVNNEVSDLQKKLGDIANMFNNFYNDFKKICDLMEEHKMENLIISLDIDGTIFNQNIDNFPKKIISEIDVSQQYRMMNGMVVSDVEKMRDEGLFTLVYNTARIIEPSYNLSNYMSIKLPSLPLPDVLISSSGSSFLYNENFLERNGFTNESLCHGSETICLDFNPLRNHLKSKKNISDESILSDRCFFHVRNIRLDDEEKREIAKLIAEWKDVVVGYYSSGSDGGIYIYHKKHNKGAGLKKLINKLMELGYFKGMPVRIISGGDGLADVFMMTNGLSDLLESDSIESGSGNDIETIGSVISEGSVLDLAMRSHIGGIIDRFKKDHLFPFVNTFKAIGSIYKKHEGIETE